MRRNRRGAAQCPPCGSSRLHHHPALAADPEAAHRRGIEGALPISLWDERGPDEIAHPGCACERLVVCRTPLPAEGRARERRQLIAAAEQKLDGIVAATKRLWRPRKSRWWIDSRRGGRWPARKRRSALPGRAPTKVCRFPRCPYQIAEASAPWDDASTPHCVEWHERGAFAPVLFVEERREPPRGLPLRHERSPTSRQGGVRVPRKPYPSGRCRRRRRRCRMTCTDAIRTPRPLSGGQCRAHPPAR